MNATFNLAVLPGDGIGNEVIAETVRVLQAVESKLQGIILGLHPHPAGAQEYLQSGTPLPEATFEACRQSDAVLLGAMGLPDVRWPDGKEMTPQLDLREKLELYCGLRPIRLFHPADSPLKAAQPNNIDLVIVRESTEGLFSGRLSAGSETDGEVRDQLRVTRTGTERVCRAAFKLAQSRRSRVSCVDKANVLPSMVFFREIFDQVAKEFPDVKADHVYVDAAALYLVQCPQRFDVIVTENMFGDILSDLAASLIGGMGMAPSGDIGDGVAVFQPSHGSAPDIAGKGVANPVACILSAALLLEWLQHPETMRGAHMIRTAVEQVFANPKHRTPDLGGNLSTRQMTDLILASLG